MTIAGARFANRKAGRSASFVPVKASVEVAVDPDARAGAGRDAGVGEFLTGGRRQRAGLCVGQRRLAGDYKSITNGVVLIATIIFWSYFFNWAGHRFPLLHRLFHPSPKPLIKDGELVPENMAREMVTEEELIGKLRRQGLTDVKAVREARVETDGQISVVSRD